MKMYRTSGNAIDIEEREIIRETKCTVSFSKENLFTSGIRIVREKKDSEWAQWHTTWEDAHNHLFKKAESRLNSARLRLQKAQGALGNVKGLKKPTQ